jgi:hypothetical protein
MSTASPVAGPLAGGAASPASSPSDHGGGGSSTPNLQLGGGDHLEEFSLLGSPLARKLTLVQEVAEKPQWNPTLPVEVRVPPPLTRAPGTVYHHFPVRLLSARLAGFRAWNARAPPSSEAYGGRGRVQWSIRRAHKVSTSQPRCLIPRLDLVTFSLGCKVRTVRVLSARQP